jgi:hypothetical protein
MNVPPTQSAHLFLNTANDRVTLPALRSVLRFLQVAGHAPMALAGAFLPDAASPATCDARLVTTRCRRCWPAATRAAR